MLITYILYTLLPLPTSTSSPSHTFTYLHTHLLTHSACLFRLDLVDGRLIPSFAHSQDKDNFNDNKGADKGTDRGDLGTDKDNIKDNVEGTGNATDNVMHDAWTEEVGFRNILQVREYIMV